MPCSLGLIKVYQLINLFVQFLVFFIILAQNGDLCKFHVLCDFYVVEINIFDTIFAFVSIIMYEPENWPILANYLVKSAGRFLYFNCLLKNTKKESVDE